MASSASPPAARGSNPGTASTGTGNNRSVNSGEAPWFMATRATNHMTGDKSLISNLVPVSNQVIKAGVGEGMQVCGRGSVNTETVVLPDVWYVPGLTMNQVSVGHLTKDPDLVVQFGGGMCRISKVSDGSVLGIAPLRPDRKYAVQFLKIQQGESAWFIATFATNHMTGDERLISNLVPVSNKVIKAGVGEGMQVCGKGCVNTKTLVLPDVWYVPGLTMNQVSVGQLTQDPDLIVEIGGGACRISKKSDGSVLGKAHLRSDHKYVVDFLKIKMN